MLSTGCKERVQVLRRLEVTLTEKGEHFDAVNSNFLDQGVRLTES